MSETFRPVVNKLAIDYIKMYIIYIYVFIKFKYDSITMHLFISVYRGVANPSGTVGLYWFNCNMDHAAFCQCTEWGL
jgi:hypothetical protein